MSTKSALITCGIGFAATPLVGNPGGWLGMWSLCTVLILFLWVTELWLTDIITRE